MSNTITPTQAKIDAALDKLNALAEHYAEELTGDNATAMIALVDGSMYSPSWRAINGLEEIFQSDLDGYWSEYINDSLTDWENGFGECGCTVGWVDGELAVRGAFWVDTSDPDAVAERASEISADAVEALKKLYELYEGDEAAVGEHLYEIDKAARRAYRS